MRRLALLLLFLALAVPVRAQDAQSRLWDAAVAGDTLEIRQAVADGAVVDSLDTRRSRNGRRALNWAALNNRVDAIAVLLELGAPLEAVNITGFSALHHAAEAGSMEAAQALLAAGADPAHANNAGMLPAATARELGHAALADLLEAAARERETPQR
jgi:ankyrin repeat protein